MNFLKKLDKGVDTFLKYFTAVLVMLLTIIVCLMVFSRYVLRINLGGIEELPVFFMCACIWLGGVRVARDDKFVKIEIIYSFIKNEKAQDFIRMITALIGGLVLAFYIRCAWLFVYRAHRDATITPSLGWPSWIVYSVSLIGTVGMTIYFFVNAYKYARRLMSK